MGSLPSGGNSPSTRLKQATALVKQLIVEDTVCLARFIPQAGTVQTTVAGRERRGFGHGATTAIFAKALTVSFNLLRSGPRFVLASVLFIRLKTRKLGTQVEFFQKHYGH